MEKNQNKENNNEQITKKIDKITYETLWKSIIRTNK